MKRYTVLPVTLYRFQTGIKPKLRQKSAQASLNRSSFDFKLGANNLYNPMEGDQFVAPNGLSMRPLGLNLADFFQGFRGKGIYELPKDLILPESLIVIHEHSDHFSLQTRQPTQPQKFCLEVEELLKKMKRLTKEEMNAIIIKHNSK